MGRLRVDEMTDRIGSALEAQTLGQLDDLVYDLPREPLMDEPVLEPRPPLWHYATLWARAAQLFVLNVACLGIWAVDGVGAPHHGFWPGWVGAASVFMFFRKANRVRAREDRRRRRALQARTPPRGLSG
ncbi:MAG: hypothetical protein JWM85_1696 [Acidimicrobiaceae bacterium]|nr:hypothetical protein [Acidimicrobiaceae bacterium]